MKEPLPMPATLEKKPMAKKQEAVTSVVIEVQLGELPIGHHQENVTVRMNAREARVMAMLNSWDNENDERVCDSKESDHVGDMLSRSFRRLLNKIGDEAGIE